MNNEGIVYFVSTPIGNLGDITLRALDTLKSVDFIACEDTRHSIKLLNHFEISKPLIAYHKFNETSGSASIIERIRNGESCAVISDAGTPLVCDPGNDLVKLLIENNIEFYTIPGANAFLPALIYSGFDMKGFTFFGFFSDSKKQRCEEMSGLLDSPVPTVVYLPPHDCLKILKEIAAAAPERRLSLSKEITKLHETTYRGTADEILTLLGESVRGEFVLVIDAGLPKAKVSYTEEELDKLFSELTVTTGSKKNALKELAAISGTPKRELYDRFMK